jgi:choline dehydrogenase-like flavoprotein
MDFDTVIVGGGAAGVILAARMSKAGRRRIALIEAGMDTPPDATPSDITDVFPVSYSNPRYFWPGIEATGRAGDQSKPYLQARVLGGGSSVMGMWALRGKPDDYNAWREAGAEGWGWEDVLPSFNRMERDLDFAGPLHGENGPIPVRRHPVECWPGFARDLLAAAVRRGLDYRHDINGDFADGVFPVPVTNDGTRRVTSATGYLTPPVRRRPNLAILCNSEVKRVRFNGHVVSGVEIARPAGPMTITCSDVILAAGAIGSPALLLRSGIGPAAELKALSIEPVADRPGVGRDLQNHCIVNLATRIIPSARQNRALRTYGLACARLTSRHPMGRRGDLHLQFIARTSLHAHGDRLGVVGAALYAPLSRGAIRLASADPARPPRIDFHLLEHPADRDRLATAIRLALDLLDDPQVRSIRGYVFTVLPSSLVRRLNRPSPINRLASVLAATAIDAPEPIRRSVLGRAGRLLPSGRLTLVDAAALLQDITAIFHPVGTCRIGRKTDPQAVVDSDCRVLGVGGLRVIDASIMPLIPTANTCLPVMMIAEHAAQRIRHSDS